jgi:uncharacterized SAM-binding protein YcdF (DUF218 family)
MFFILSKIFWTLAQPANLLIFLLVVAAVWLWRAPRSGRWFVTVLVTCAVLASTLPVGEYMLRKIENTYSIPVLPQRVDGVIMLAGLVWTEGSASHHQVQLNEKATRLTQFMVLAHKYPHAKLVFTGGSGNPMMQDAREADYIKQLWTDMGMDPSRVIWERDSRNTYENVVASKALAQPKPGENWVLITSAVHMPRAVAIFEKQNWKVIPYPVDFITIDTPIWQREFNASSNIWLLSEAMKETIGLAAYRATGKAD